MPDTSGGANRARNVRVPSGTQAGAARRRGGAGRRARCGLRGPGRVDLPGAAGFAGAAVPSGSWEQRTGGLAERFTRAAQTFNQQQSRAVLTVSPVPAGSQDLRARLIAAATGRRGARRHAAQRPGGRPLSRHRAALRHKRRAQGQQGVGPAQAARPRDHARGHTWQGRLVSLPAITSAIAVFYDGGLLRQSSLPEPGAGWTWDAFVDMTRKVKQATGKWGCSSPPAGNTEAIYWHNLGGLQQCGPGGRAAGALERDLAGRARRDPLPRGRGRAGQELYRPGQHHPRREAAPTGGTPFASGQRRRVRDAVAGHAADLGRAQARRRRGADAPAASGRPATPSRTTPSCSAPARASRETAALQLAELWIARPETQVLYATLTNPPAAYADARRLPAFQQYLKADPRVEVFESATPQVRALRLLPPQRRGVQHHGQVRGGGAAGEERPAAAHAQADREDPGACSTQALKR